MRPEERKAMRNEWPTSYPKRINHLKAACAVNACLDALDEAEKKAFELEHRVMRATMDLAERDVRIAELEGELQRSEDYSLKRIAQLVNASKVPIHRRRP